MTTARTPPERLRDRAEEVLHGDRESARLLSLLRRLVRVADESSDDAVFAHRHLAELLMDRDPWRASTHARALTRARPDDDRGWAALGLSQAQLGHARFAVSAFERAANLSPSNPWYAHNLGLLLDVALNRPADAIPWLERAADRHRSVEFVRALAGALERAGRPADARALRRKPLAKKGFEGALQRTLLRGTERLPLGPEQRREAVVLAQRAVDHTPPTDRADARILAAAVTFAVVERNGLPLSAAEVAACYRVRTALLRERLASLPRAPRAGTKGRSVRKER
jgi:tetratricopeptide (TPR) repeat protein